MTVRNRRARTHAAMAVFASFGMVIAACAVVGGGGATAPIVLPNAVVSATPSTGCAPLDVDFSSVGTTDAVWMAFDWQFGDGNSSDEQNPTHTYQSEGTYTATLVVTEMHGLLSSFSLIVVVSCDPPIPDDPDDPVDVDPELECVIATPVGNFAKTGFIARFGYRGKAPWPAPNETPIGVPVGPQNKFTNWPEDGGQPAAFYKNRHYNVFEVDFDDTGTHDWIVNNTGAEARVHSRSCGMHGSPPLFGDALVGGIYLNWMTYDDFVWDHKSWRIYRDGVVLVELDKDDQDYIDTTVVSGQTYTYEVRGVAWSGYEDPAGYSIDVTAL
jgi:hypothetical protein